MSGHVDTIKASAIDGRARNPRYIQGQLKRLHEELVKNAAVIRDAILEDTDTSPTEVDIEFCLAVDAVRAEYLSINAEKVFEEECLIAHSKDSPDKKEAVGIAYIVPSTHTLLYSVVAPLASAIAGGNCVVLQLGQTLSSINDILRKVLNAALDFDTFSIVDSRPDDTELFKSAVQVIQGDQDQGQPSSRILLSPSSKRVVAIVDRTADINQAAKAIARSRFTFGGRSPYSPDVVLVNEFRLREFSDAVLQQSAKHFVAEPNSNGPSDGLLRKKRRESRVGLLEQVKADDGCNLLVSGFRGSVVQVNSRSSTILKRKINEPILAIHAISSLDDAIDFANSGTSSLLGLYTFAEPKSAKYLSQFIDASISIVNHIPINLLVGPASPIGHPTSPIKRYNQTLFTAPKPAYIQVSNASAELDSVLDSSLSTKGLSKPRKDLLDSALAALPPTGQSLGGQVGFFEQGLITGAIVFILPVVSTVLGLSAWGLWAGFKRLRSG